MGHRTHQTLILIVVTLFSMQTTANPTLNASSTIPLTFSESTQKHWNYTKSYQPTMPNVTQYLDTEFTDFTPSGATVYTGDDQVTGYTGSWYYMTVTMTNLHVVIDHDSVGAGDILIQGGINNFDNRYPTTGDFQLNNGEDQVLSEVLFTGWAVNLGIDIEVKDDDAGLFQSLGLIQGHVTALSNETFTLFTDIGDASITFAVEVTQTDSVFLASELLELYKPELWVDDETGSTEMPDEVFGRVISGNDHGVDAFVLQYFFYWNAEYSPDGIGGFKTHDNDFEAFLLYLDKSDPISPYRIVFNNWFYTDISQAPSTTIAIFEDTTSTGDFTYPVDINSDLQGLLGTNVTLNAEVHDLSEILDWTYGTLSSENAFTYTPNGVISVHLTVETSYHTFDLGPGGSYYGFAYSISSLTDDVIVELYSLVEDTFASGVHIWTYFGIDVPQVAPFTFDVTQVFTAPYAITSYQNVISNAAAITRALHSRLDIDINGYIGIGFEVPTTLQLTYPSQLAYGTNSFSLTLNPNIDQTEITLLYGLHVNISYVFWFMSGEILYNHEGEISLNPFTDEIAAIATKLGLGDYGQNDVKINSYLTGGLVLHPTLLGTIIEGQLNLDILKVVDTLFGANPNVKLILKLLDFVIEDFTLTLNASLDAVVRHDLTNPTSRITLSKNEFVYTDSTPQDFTVTITEGFDLGQGLVLTIPDAGYDLDFTVDWSFELGFKSPVSKVIGDISFPIGTYPSWTANILTAPGGIFTIPGSTKASSSKSVSMPLFLMSTSCIAILSTITRRK